MVPNKPLVARAGLDPAVRTALRESLLQCNDKAALKELKLTGFLPATDGDYDKVREDMRAARAFNLPETRPARPTPGGR
jgi:ABC-type phosphate/phosphonate transport system substrate-binding protein